MNWARLLSSAVRYHKRWRAASLPGEGLAGCLLFQRRPPSDRLKSESLAVPASWIQGSGPSGLARAHDHVARHAVAPSACADGFAGLPDHCCEKCRACDERHSREEHRCLQPRHQPIVTHSAPQSLNCVGRSSARKVKEWLLSGPEGRFGARSWRRSRSQGPIRLRWKRRLRAPGR